MEWVASHRKLLMTILRYLFLVLVVGFAVFYFVSQWTEIIKVIDQIPLLSLTLSGVALACGLGFGTACWVTILNGLGAKVPPLRASEIMLVGQLGKYVPGSVWAYVMQMELGKQYGILRPRVLVTALYSVIIGVVASLLWGGLALPILLPRIPELSWLFLLLPIGLASLHPRVMTFIANKALRLFRRPPLEHVMTLKTVALGLAWSLIAYAFYGVHLWILVNSISSPRFIDVLILTGAISLSFSVSVIAFILPSGIGVREVILIGAMSLFLTVEKASAVSLISRGLFTLVDLLAAGIAVLFVILRRRSLAAQTKEYLREENNYEHSLTEEVKQ